MLGMFPSSRSSIHRHLSEEIEEEFRRVLGNNDAYEHLIALIEIIHVKSIDLMEGLGVIDIGFVVNTRRLQGCLEGMQFQGMDRKHLGAVCQCIHKLLLNSFVRASKMYDRLPRYNDATDRDMWQATSWLNNYLQGSMSEADIEPQEIPPWSGVSTGVCGACHGLVLI